MQTLLQELGEKITEVTVVRVLIAEGQTVEADQAVMEVETGKATVEVPCTARGKVLHLLIKAGDKLKVGAPYMDLEGDSSAVSKPAPPAAVGRPAPPVAPAKIEPQKNAVPLPAATPPASGLVAAAPSVRHLARELGVDINQVRGTGPGGRVSAGDVKSFSQQNAGTAPAANTGITIPPLPDFSKWGPVEKESMNGVRRATAEHMALAWSRIPHVTQHDKADITDLEKLRKKHEGKTGQPGGKLTVTAILIKVVEGALKVHPKLNASIDTVQEQVIYKKYCHIGVAVDTPRGLLVPVIRDVDKKDIFQIAAELAQLAEKARAGKLELRDFEGGTFTISNLGGIGGGFFTPIVNYPQVAILGVGRSALEQIHADGGFQPRLMLPLSLSYDHRLVDGADGARFLRWVTEAVKDPSFMEKQAKAGN
ncbi:MAG: 2-oxo acid dehydrogenase subunit E2 [Verrucomicrobiae bacterium]|nr:2-oxo acid dehydrogenase subunit E2 [Verrucomicrobiae bacterium]